MVWPHILSFRWFLLLPSPKALMSLFVLASKDGWVDIMYDGLDAVGVDQQVGLGWAGSTWAQAALSMMGCRPWTERGRLMDKMPSKRPHPL